MNRLQLTFADRSPSDNLQKVRVHEFIGKGDHNHEVELRLPLCREWRCVEWADRYEVFTCHRTQRDYSPPLPTTQAHAYVNTHEWPAEMESAVINSKGRLCCVPDCDTVYETLDHNIPYSRGGFTSVANLFPMCETHNLEKGDKTYREWMNDRYRKFRSAVASLLHTRGK